VIFLYMERGMGEVTYGWDVDEAVDARGEVVGGLLTDEGAEGVGCYLPG
jgi:hypothetical protein